MKTLNLILSIVLISQNLMAQELVLDDGIYVEKPDYTNKEKHRYSHDNISYKQALLET